MNLTPEVQAELAAAVDVLVASGVDRALARQKVWQNYQNDLIAIAQDLPSVAECATPELPPPKWSQQDLSRTGNKPFYQRRADDGAAFWTPDRKAKNRSELEKLKNTLGIRTCQKTI
ncbi:hypothetical protein [uncultured Deefgea sp.]|uniref:hypothetical protein n=1 Tax=uncultured Deefgea sp. TaxID=1304914 RepID=UPI002636BD9E|nr:hypothetical protein [uncultured Deefgea sp.]